MLLKLELAGNNAKSIHSWGGGGDLPGVQLPSGLPAQLLLSLSLQDPTIRALGVQVSDVIRLVHPLHYSQGQEFIYRHVGRGVLFGSNGFDVPGDPDWPTTSFPSQLPEASLRSAIPQRDEGYDPSCVYLGQEAPTIQKYSHKLCIGCGLRLLNLIASIPNNPFGLINIWSNEFVGILFWCCGNCKSIVTHNECD